MDTTQNDPIVHVPDEVSLHLSKPSERDLPENCALCDKILHPIGITFDVNTMDVHVWCQNCGKKNSCGMIREKQCVLPSLPVVKRLVGYHITTKCYTRASGYPHETNSSSSLEIPEEHNMSFKSREEQSTLETKTAGYAPTFNRLTPEEISELMCLEARAIRRKRQELGLKF